MKQLAQDYPRISIIDSNRLFRQKISYLLQNESRTSFENIDVFDSFDAFNKFNRIEEIDLLIIDETEFDKCSPIERQKIVQRDLTHAHTIIMSMQIALHKKSEISSPHPKVTWLVKSIDPLLFLELVENCLGMKSVEQLNHDHIGLTPRESEILEELVNGLSNKEIARKLAISDSTVKVHVQNILKKINVSSRVEAAVYAVRHQLIA